MIRPLPRKPETIKLDVSLAIVNIVLLLILFFLATGQLMNPRSENVDLARTQDLPLDALPLPILIVQDNGSWELNGTPVAPDLLTVALNDLPEDDLLHILINRAAPATALLDVMNAPALTDTTLRLVTLRVPEQDQ